MPKAHWGNVVLAAVFAIAVIAVAGGTYWYENNGGLPFLKQASVAPVADLPWSGTSAPQYEKAQDGTPLTATIAQQFAAVQGQSGTASDQDIATAAQKAAAQVTLPDFTEKISIQALHASSTEPVPLYADILYRILRTANPYGDELAAFRKTVSANNTSGTPSLVATAKQYKAIETALVEMAVPSSLLQQHLAVVNAIGTLANTVYAMGSWGGDPFAGIAYLNAYTVSNTAVQSTLTDLANAVSSAVKTK